MTFPKILPILFVLAMMIALPAAAQENKMLAQADSLFVHYHEEKALQSYNNILKKDADNLSALWHSSILYSRIGHRFDDKNKEKNYYRKAKKRAERALKVDSTDTQANFVMAAAMGRMALVVGAKKRVAASRAIKKYAERSLKADSSNAGAWHILGRWNYEVANLNFFERLAANTLFGGIPKGASSEKAVKYINKAISLNPEYVIYYRDLANAYKDLHKDDKAIAACRRGIQQQANTKEDQNLKNDCRKIIKDLQ